MKMQEELRRVSAGGLSRCVYSKEEEKNDIKQPTSYLLMPMCCVMGIECVCVCSALWPRH